jgi:ASC-1-like (ASCH) protein
LALSRTLNNIKEKLGSEIMPTVMSSGRGYHTILPLNSNGVILESIKEFEGINNISIKFLRYVESHLSLKKSDPQHNHIVSFNNCMLRIPGSINSENGQTVKIIQKWNHLKPEINYLLAGFTRYIINEKYIELIKAQKRERNSSTYKDNNNRVSWIERLLETPIRDHRKYCIWRVLTPYLLNIRKLSEQETTDIIEDWLNRCNQLRRLDFNYKQKIKDGKRRCSRRLSSNKSGEVKRGKWCIVFSVARQRFNLI